MNACMTNPNVPNEEQIQNIDPDDDKVAIREEDEGYKISVYVIEGESIQETSARTYTRAFGHYFVEEDSVATEILDQFFTDFKSENSIIDSFGRDVGQAYEVSVEVREDIDENNYLFRRSNATEIELPHHSRLCEDIDEFLDSIQNEI